MRMMRCKVEEINVTVTATNQTETITEGMVMDFDRELSKGYTLGMALEGRHDMFEEVHEKKSKPAMTQSPAKDKE